MESRKMRPGDQVVIYEDPTTEQRPEGPAFLKLKLSGTKNLERWLVVFQENPGRIFKRWIKKPARI